MAVWEKPRIVAKCVIKKMSNKLRITAGRVSHRVKFNNLFILIKTFYIYLSLLSSSWLFYFIWLVKFFKWLLLFWLNFFIYYFLALCKIIFKNKIEDNYLKTFWETWSGFDCWFFSFCSFFILMIYSWYFIRCLFTSK